VYNFGFRFRCVYLFNWRGLDNGLGNGGEVIVKEEVVGASGLCKRVDDVGVKLGVERHFSRLLGVLVG
jgi:hypothetical protein